jgi:hypothetical protein
MTNRNTIDVDRASQATRRGGACKDDHFAGSLQTAANAVTPAIITFDLTVSGESWRMSQGRSPR